MGTGRAARALQTKVSVALALTVAAVALSVVGPTRPVAASDEPAAPTPAPAAVAPGSGYVPLTPSRILDTREALGATGSLGPGQSFDLVVAGRGGVPSTGVGAVAFNLTGVGATASTFITQWPTGEPRPFAATLNLVPGEIAPNMVIAKVGSGGAVSLYNYAGTVDLVADVVGWFPPDAYQALTPARILDTREAFGAAGSVPAGRSVDLQVTGVGGVPTTGVGAVVFNLTGVGATASTFITQWPTGEPRPFAATLNLVPGEIAPNLVIAKVGAGGMVSLFNYDGTVDLVADVVGWFRGDAPVDELAYRPLTPARVLDTRDPGRTAVGAGQSIDVRVTGVAGVPTTDVAAVAFNLTGVDATASTFVTQWPTGEARPFAATLNLVPREVAPNLVIAKVGAGGSVSLYNFAGSAHLVADVVGWFPSVTAGPAASPGPPLDGIPTGPAAAPTTDGSTALRLVPDSFVLAPGEKGRARLVENDADGKILGAGSLDGVTIDSTGGDATLAVVGDGWVEVTAGDQIETVVFGVHVPGHELALPLTVSVAVLEPGVQRLGPEQVLFPPSNMPGVGDPFSLVDPNLTSNGAGPFPIADLRARLLVPDDVEAPAPEDVTGRFPVVLRGAPPATGTLVLGTGGVPVIGRVVEPPGLPTLVADGFALVTVEIAPPQDLFVELVYEIDSDDMRAVGVMGDGVLPEGPDEPAQTLGPTMHGGRSRALPARTPLQNDGEGGTGQSGTVGGNGVPADENTGPRRGGPCKLESGPRLYDLRLGPQVTFTPILQHELSVHRGELEGSLNRLGFTFDAKLLATLKLTEAFTAKLTCPIATWERPLTFWPPGFLSILFTVEIHPAVNFVLEGKIEGGPRLEFGIQCQIKTTAVIGTETFGGVTRDISDWSPPHPDCKTVHNESSINPLETFPVYVEVTMGLPVLEAKIGVRILGVIAQFAGWLFGEPDAGLFNLITGQVGARLKLTWENGDLVRTNKVAAAKGVVELFSTLKPNSDNVMKPLNRMLRVPPKTGGSITLFEVAAGLVSLYQPVNPTAIKVRVGDQTLRPLPNVIYVEEGDSLLVQSTLDVPAGIIVLGSPLLAFPSVWEWKPSNFGLGFWEKTDFFGRQPFAEDHPVPANLTLDVAEITDEQCEAMRDEPKEFQLFVGNGPLVFLIFNSFGGTFKVQCVEGKMRVEPESISTSQDVTLHSRGAREDEWKVKASTVPSWLSVTPMSGPLAESPEDEQSIPVEVEVTEAPTECGEPRTATIEFESRDRGTTQLKFEEGDLCFIRFEPGRIEGVGTHSVSLVTQGLVEDDFDIDEQSFPDWLTGGPTHEVELPPTDGVDDVHFVSFTVTGRAPTCERQPARVHNVQVTTHTRGSTKLTVVDPPVEASGAQECKPKDGSGTGDPHMTSFDGAYYDAQVLGEYTYLVSTQDATFDVELQARHEPSHDRLTSFVPTSVTGAALRVDDHLIEVYAKDASGAWTDESRVLIDGTPTPLAQGVPIEVAPELSLVLTVHQIDIVGPGGLKVSIHKWPGSMLDVRVSVPPKSPYVGLLGSPDDDLSNDLVTRDGSQSFTVAQIRGHTSELYAFTDSWRITDLDESLFTVGYAGFGAANQPQNYGDLREYQERAFALLSGLSAVCDGTADLDNHYVDGLALELAIGRPPSDLTRYSCSYRVDGRAHAGDYGIPGLTVEIAVEGLQTCTTTTGWEGEYFCVLSPDPDAPEPELPLDVDVTARWPGEDVVAVSGSGEFAELAPVAARPVGGVTVDLQIDPLTLPNVVVSGIMEQHGEPHPGPVPVRIDAFDADGEGLASFYVHVTPDQTTGEYSFTRILPFGATKAVVVATIGVRQEEWPTVTDDALESGINEMTLSFDHDPALVHVSGAWTGPNGAPLDEDFVVLDVRARNASGVIVYARTHTEVPHGDGTYSVDVELPGSAVSVEADVQMGLDSFDWFRSGIVPVDPGPNSILLDVEYRPPVVHFTGTMVDESGAAPVSPTHGAEPRSFLISAWDASGELIVEDLFRRMIAVDDATGAFAQDIVLPRNTARITARSLLGFSESDFDVHKASLAGFGPDDRKDMVWDIVWNPPTVHVTGTATVLGDPAAWVLLRVESTERFGVRKQDLAFETAADGSYSTDVTLGLSATAVTVYVIADGGTNEFSATETGLTRGDARTMTIDAHDAPVWLHLDGTMKALGVPANDATVRIHGLDGAGAIAQHDGADFFVTADVDVDPATGEYSLDAGLPEAAVVGVVEVVVDGDYSRTTEFALMSPGRTDVTYDVDFSKVVVDGTLLDGGQPIADMTEFDVEVREHSASGIDTRSIVVGYDSATGAFELVHIAFGDVTKIELELQLGSVPPLVVDGLTPRVVDVSWDVDLADLRTVTLTGTMTDGGTPVPDSWSAQFALELYEFDPAEWSTDPPYVQVDALETSDVDFVGGTWTWTVRIPQTVSILELTVFAGDADHGEFVQGFQIAGTGDPTFTYDFDLAVPRMVFAGSSRFEAGEHGGCALVPFMSHVDVFVGATPSDRYLVVPDPVTGEFTLTLAVPQGATSVRLDPDRTVLYPDATFADARMVPYPVDSGVSHWLFDMRTDCPPPG